MRIFLAVPALLVPIHVFAADARFGRVVEVVGVARSSASAEPLKAGAPVSAGDRVTTGEGAQVRILLQDEAAIQIGPASEVVIEHPGKITVIRLAFGSLLSRVRAAVKKGMMLARFQVRTPNATMGVRGTTFFVKETPKKPTFFCACEGTVDVAWAGGKASITTKHHDAPKWIDSKSKSLAPAVMGEEHKDSDIDALQKILDQH